MTEATELFDAAETARRLDVTEGTLAVWRSTRRYPLRYIKIGRKVRYAARDIEKFLAARSVSGVPERSRRRKTAAA